MSTEFTEEEQEIINNMNGSEEIETTETTEENSNESSENLDDIFDKLDSTSDEELDETVIEVTSNSKDTKKGDTDGSNTPNDSTTTEPSSEDGETNTEDGDKSANAEEAENAETDEGDSGDNKNKEPEKTTEKEFITSLTEEDKNDIVNKLFSPFKAAGSQISVSSVDEAIALMQKGVDYTRKTNQLAEHRKIIATLEEGGITSPDDLNFALDLLHGDKQAIAKLLKDKDIDVYDLDEDSEGYAPKDHTAKIDTGTENLSAKLHELQDKPLYNDLVDTIDKQWDNSSIELLKENPNDLDIIYQHMEHNIYNVVAGELMKQKALGTIPDNEPFLQSYIRIGMQLTDAGVFDKNQPATASPDKSKAKTTADKTILANTRNTADKTAELTEKDILAKLENASEEDFEKLVAQLPT